METDLHPDLSELQAAVCSDESLNQHAADMAEPEPDFRKVIFEIALSQMTPREEKVIRMLCGLDNTPKHTQQEVADALGIPCERVRVIFAKFKSKRNCRPRHPMKKKDYII